MSSSAHSDITLKPGAFFGISGKLRNNIHYIGPNDDKCCYLGGQNVVINNIRKASQKGFQEFIQLKSHAHVIQEGILDKNESDGTIINSEKANENIDTNSVPTSSSNSVMTKENNGLNTKIPSSPEGYTTIAVSPNKKNIAVAERAERGIVSIYEYPSGKHRNTLYARDIKSSEIVSISFSQDGTQLLTLTGSPDYKLHCWNWAKASVPIAKIGLSELLNKKNMNDTQDTEVDVDSTKTSLDGTIDDQDTANSTNSKEKHSNRVKEKKSHKDSFQLQQEHQLIDCSFSPLDSTLCLVYGYNFARFFRITETGDMRQLPLSPTLENTEKNFVAHCWLRNPADYVVLATETGELCLLKSGNFLCTICDKFERKKSESEIGVEESTTNSKGTGHNQGGSDTINSTNNQTKSDQEKEEIEKITSEESHIVKLSRLNAKRKTSLLATSQGFIVGGYEGKFNFYTFHEDSIKKPATMFTCTHEWKADQYLPGSYITGLAISSSEHELLSVCTSNQLLKIPFASISNITPDMIKPVYATLHAPGPIVGLSMATRKPLIATCGKNDRMIGIWNYTERKEILHKSFQEEIHSIAFHPSGFHLCVGFHDRLKLMHILLDDFKKIIEYPVKACKQCEFSKGGQLLAAVSGTMIVIYNVYTAERKMDLRGHNGRICSLEWSPDDKFLCSSGTDGAIYLWNIEDGGKRIGEFNHKGVSYTSTIFNQEEKTIYSAGTDGLVTLLDSTNLSVLREIEVEPAAGTALNGDTDTDTNTVEGTNDKNGNNNNDNLTNYHPSASRTNIGTLALSKFAKILYGGTSATSDNSSGMAGKRGGFGGSVGAVNDTDSPSTNSSNSAKPASIRAYLKNKNLEEYIDYPCMSNRITNLLLSQDEKFLIVTDEDGSLCIFCAEEGEEGTALLQAASARAATAVGKDKKTISEDLTILITQSDLEDKTAHMVELKNKVEELGLHNDYNLRLKDMAYQERIREVEEKFGQDKDMMQHKLDKIKEESTELESEYEDKIRQMEERHRHELHEVESEHQNRIMNQVEKYQHLVQENKLSIDRCENDRKALIEQHRKYFNSLEKDFEFKLNSEIKKRIDLTAKKIELENTFKEKRGQTEDDIDSVINHIETKYDIQLSEEKDQMLKLKSANGIMSKKEVIAKREFEEQKEKIRSLNDTETGLLNQLKGLSAEINLHKKEIKQKDVSISDKEKKIFELKRKNQELEKFKFVLDYKIKELKKQVEPREVEIIKMKELISKTDNELERYHKRNSELDESIGETRKKVDNMQMITSSNRKKITSLNLIINQFKAGISDCIKLIQWPEKLANQVAILQSSHPLDVQEDTGVEEDVLQEYSRQRDYLQSSLETLQKKFDKDINSRKSFNSKMRQDNLGLLNEIKRQREENKNEKNKLNALMGIMSRNGVIVNIDEVSNIEEDEVANIDEDDGDVLLHGHSNNQLKKQENEDTKKTAISNNKVRIAKLREVLKELEGRVVNQNFKTSKEVLPPVESVIGKEVNVNM